MANTNLKTLNPDDVLYIVVHCSATPADMDVDIADIDRWHRQRGFRKVGYHYFIKRDGTVQEGRAHHEHGTNFWEGGAHVEDYNMVSVGVCMAGGLDKKGKAEDNFTKAQYNALALVLATLKVHFKNADIMGHRDFVGVKKDCPSFDVREWITTRPELNYGEPEENT